MARAFIADNVFRREVVFTRDKTDPFGAVRPDAVAWECQEIATEHYEALGLGRAVSDSFGCVWVLTRSETEYLAPLPTDVRLRLDTWSGRRSHGLFWRHYRLSDGEKVLLRSVSVWTLMDVESRAMSKKLDWITEAGGVSQPEELPTTLKKPPLPEGEDRQVLRTVTEAETDRNGHLNNSLYLRWGQELLPEDYAAGHRLRRLWIEYKKELPLGTEAELRWHLTDNVLVLRGRTGDRDAFAMRCDYDTI